jgi:hypothetical protein
MNLRSEEKQTPINIAVFKHRQKQELSSAKITL